MPDLTEQSYENAKRIVDCLNACEGINSYRLRENIIEQLKEALEKALDTLAAYGVTEDGKDIYEQGEQVLREVREG